jgi:hypothetical protein
LCSMKVQRASGSTVQGEFHFGEAISQRKIAVLRVVCPWRITRGDGGFSHPNLGRSGTNNRYVG